MSRYEHVCGGGRVAQQQQHRGRGPGSITFGRSAGKRAAAAASVGRQAGGSAAWRAAGGGAHSSACISSVASLIWPSSVRLRRAMKRLGGGGGGLGGIRPHDSKRRRVRECSDLKAALRGSRRTMTATTVPRATRVPETSAVWERRPTAPAVAGGVAGGGAGDGGGGRWGPRTPAFSRGLPPPSPCFSVGGSHSGVRWWGPMVGLS